MKKLISLALLLSFGVQAETYVCDIKNTDKTLTFGLVKELPGVCENEGMEEEEFCWDSVSKFKLSIQTTELPFAEHVEYGTAYEHDVRLEYTSNTSDIRFGMYLDEDEPVHFTLNGKDMVFSNCRFYDFNQQ